MIREAVETCPYCGHENIYPDYDDSSHRYIANCNRCKKEMHLCDECLHAEDNQLQYCDWHEEKHGDEIYSCCFRGKVKLAKEDVMYF